MADIIVTDFATLEKIKRKTSLFQHFSIFNTNCFNTQENTMKDF